MDEGDIDAIYIYIVHVAVTDMSSKGKKKRRLKTSFCKKSISNETYLVKVDTWID